MKAKFVIELIELGFMENDDTVSWMQIIIDHVVLRIMQRNLESYIQFNIKNFSIKEENDYVLKSVIVSPFQRDRKKQKRDKKNKIKR